MQTASFSLPQRPRRLRTSNSILNLVRENHLSVNDLILPLFVHDHPENVPIHAMPGCFRWSLDGLLEQVGKAYRLGINCVVLFPKVDNHLKTEDAVECTNDNGLIPRAIRRIKLEFPEMAVMTDVALDPYSSDGHDGIVSDQGKVLNDETIQVLCKQAVTQARAGADFIGPSDMMDGRVGEIRKALDREGFAHVGIISYTAKYASGYYGPFREALDSAPKLGGKKPIPKDKRTYQMDPANRRAAVREAKLDEEEGADILMVKPALAYMDVIRELRETSVLPIACYNVSGEYAMVKAAAEKGWINEKQVVLETLMGFKRAGADIILTYHAMDVAQWLRE